MTKRSKTPVPAWMAAYYANGVSGSVIEHYRTGRVIRVNADAPKPKSAALVAAELEYQQAKDAVDEAYWRFSRSSRVNATPVPAELCRRQEQARERLLSLRSAT